MQFIRYRDQAKRGVFSVSTWAGKLHRGYQESSFRKKIGHASNPLSNWTWANEVFRADDISPDSCSATLAIRDATPKCSNNPE